MMQTATTMLTAVGLKNSLVRSVIWVVGRWRINLALRLIGSTLTKQKIDFTRIRYIHSSVAGPLMSCWSSQSLGSSGWRPPASRH